jgi:hypothetical protein
MANYPAVEHERKVLGYHVGDYVIFHKERVAKENLINSTDPRTILVDKNRYKVTSVEMTSWSTEIHLEGFISGFNSVWFTPAI